MTYSYNLSDRGGFLAGLVGDDALGVRGEDGVHDAGERVAVADLREAALAFLLSVVAPAFAIFAYLSLAGH